MNRFSFFGVLALLIPAAQISIAQPSAEIILPNANLQITGIPPIPKSLAQSLDRYTQFQPTTVIGWHPTDGSLTLSRRAGQSNQLFRQASAGAPLEQITFFNEPVRGGAWEPKSGAYLLLTRDIGGSEANQIFRFDPKSKASVQLTDNSARHALGLWNGARTRVLITSSPLSKPGVTDAQAIIRAVDPLAPEKAELLLTINGAGFYPVLWREKEGMLWVRQFISATESKLWEYTLTTGARRELPEMEMGDEDEDNATVGSEIFVRRYDNDKGEFRKLFKLNVATGARTPVSEKIDWDVEAWALSPDRKILAFITNEAGTTMLHLRDARTLEAIDTPKLPAAQFSRLRWHPTEPMIALSAFSPNAPSDAFVINVPEKKIEQWTDSRPANFTETLSAKAEVVRWKSFDGREISGILYRPNPKFIGPRPVMVSIHGGPESQSRPSFLNRWHYYLNELGVAILLPNVRGSSGFGKTFLALDNGLLREDSVKDIGAMLDWVKSQPDLNASKIAITGGSYGGYMSLAVSTFYSDKIACAVDSVGISNFVSFLERTETYRRDLRRSEYGDEREPAMRAHLTNISPLTNAHKIKKPLFVVHGINDPRVPFFEAQQIVEKVRANGTPVWTLYADNEGHGFAKRANADYLFYAQTVFLNACFAGS